jgi:hypothetical protein
MVQPMSEWSSSVRLVVKSMSSALKKEIIVPVDLSFSQAILVLHTV